MARYTVSAALLLAALLINGCSSIPGQTEITYTAGQDLPPLSTVDTTAKFSLYAIGTQKPIWSDSLGPGDEYGFVKRADGFAYGVAKGQDIPLPAPAAASYFWKREDPRPSNDEY